MIGISQRVVREFAEGVRARGQVYFATGKVSITSARAGQVVVARVQGSDVYRVRLRFRGGQLHVACTCPYFGPEGEPCKHIWATILAADEHGLFRSAPVRSIRLVVDPQPDPRPPDGPPVSEHGSLRPEIDLAEARRIQEELLGGPIGDLRSRDASHRPPGPGQREAGYDFNEPLPGDLGGVRPPGSRAHGQPPRYGQPQHRPGNGANGSAGRRPPHGGPNGAHARDQRGRNGRRPQQRPPGRSGGPGVPPVLPTAAELLGNPTHGPAGGPGGNYGGYPPSHGPRPGFDRRQARPGKPKRIEPKAKPSLLYVIDAPQTLAQNQVVVTLARRVPRRAVGEPSKGRKKKRWQVHRPDAWRLEPEDRILLALLDEARADYNPNAAATAPAGETRLGAGPLPKRFVLRPEVQVQLVERLARTGRCRLRRTEDEMNPPALRWDDARPWRFVIDAKLADPAARRWTWRGALRRDDDRMDLAEPLVLLPGLVIQGIGRAARFDDGGVFLWMARLRHEKEMSLSEAQQDSMLSRIMGESRVPPSELVEGLDLFEVDVAPTPCLVVRAPMQARGTDMLIADLEFDYDGARVPSFPAVRMAVQTARRRVIRRDGKLETKSKERLDELGFRPIQDFRFDPGTMEVSPKRVPQAARELVADGWRVEADGILYRPASDFKLDVTSGMDWFELDGRVTFGSQDVSLPQILEAARRGDTMIALGDGSIGMLPDEWLRKYGLLADLGTATEEGTLRFSRTQAGLLDAMLAEQGENLADANFTRVREELRAFAGVEPLDAPPGFQGELRPYQREGLGWLEYLRRFGFGGILADDMGLGKTIQVLALMQRRRAKRQSHGASLIVVPRSLVFNWMQEAAKFTPRLKILDYTGPNRHALREKFDKYDLIVTTYGTLRSDIAELCHYEFDYAILDEAQAIKNADSQSAKSARLLKAKHRLAMSGTPIENHLGELWSIFEFLNPGMLGTASVFKRAAGGIGGQDEQGRKLLARALRPFILRRTKQQVVKDLPEKIEQTLFCDFEPAQRKLYDDLLAHYRSTLLRKDAEELRTSKIEVLEALLRLRQASCHPGLIDPARAGEPSAKLDMLLPQLAEVVDEGHKVLVFSQFTSFLSIVRQRLDEEGLTYEYLDGRTRNRQERVERFQNDPDCPIFLISLKAGGLGLNLTAAEYVYLLDPWWNPAVEAQAIDRSHRIGQVNNVFAYRIICRDTVEQKIIDLQQKKRDLADAILNADNRVIQSLTRDDLEFLLS